MVEYEINSIICQIDLRGILKSKENIYINQMLNMFFISIKFRFMVLFIRQKTYLTLNNKQNKNNY